MKEKQIRKFQQEKRVNEKMSSEKNVKKPLKTHETIPKEKTLKRPKNEQIDEFIRRHIKSINDSAGLRSYPGAHKDCTQL